jgi:hypothetical protein
MQRVLIKSVLGFGLVLTLAGCLGNSPQKIEVSAKPIEKPDLVLPPVDELRMREVKWYVINEDNVDQVMAELDSQGIPVGLYALTGKGYANLGQNFSDIRAMIQQQQAIIVAYENYYKQAEEALDGAVKEE